jgi:hypothetical protein
LRFPVVRILVAGMIMMTKISYSDYRLAIRRPPNITRADVSDEGSVSCVDGPPIARIFLACGVVACGHVSGL